MEWVKRPNSRPRTNVVSQQSTEPEQFERVVAGADEGPNALAFSSPRRRNWRKPRPALIWPNTDSAVSIRRA